MHSHSGQAARSSQLGNSGLQPPTHPCPLWEAFNICCTDPSVPPQRVYERFMRSSPGLLPMCRFPQDYLDGGELWVSQECEAWALSVKEWKSVERAIYLYAESHPQHMEDHMRNAELHDCLWRLWDTITYQAETNETELVTSQAIQPRTSTTRMLPRQ